VQSYKLIESEKYFRKIFFKFAVLLLVGG